MIFNYADTNVVLGPGAITFPDWPWGEQPLAPSAIKETIQILGTNSQVSSNVAGVADQPE